LIEQVFRDEWGRVLASLVGYLGDFDLAEEAAQEAFTVAAERWDRDGPPANPGAWLVTTARNRAIDRIRRERNFAAKARELGVTEDQTAATVRVQDGRTVTTDGPFAETKEALGGYYLLEADDLDGALEVAARIPAARMGGAIEVRPVVQR